MIALVFSSCAPLNFNLDDLMRAPHLNEEQAQLLSALSRAIGVSVKNITLKYPASGDNRSAVLFQNLDIDPAPEALVLYHTGDRDNESSFAILKKVAGTWRVAVDVPGMGSDIQKVDFASVRSDNKRDIVICWTMNNLQSNVISVYNFESSNLENVVTIEKADDYTVYDINNDGSDEILTVTYPPLTTQPAKIQLYGRDNGKIDVLDTYEGADIAIARFASVAGSQLNAVRNGVFMEGIARSATYAYETVVLSANGNQLFNVMEYDSTDYSDRTKRVTKVFSMAFTVGGPLEIPMNETPLPGYEDAAEKQYIIDFGSFSAGQATVDYTAYVNDKSGYLFILPRQWQGANISVTSKNDGQEITFYDFSNTFQYSTPLLKIQVVSKSDVAAKDASAPQLITTRGLFDYVATFPTSDSSYNISIEDCQQLFRFIDGTK